MLRRFEVFLAVVFFWSAVAVAAPTYNILDLGSATSGALPYGVDEYIGAPVVAMSNGYYWTQASGAVNLLPLLPSSWSATGCSLTGVNSSGLIVGMETNSGGYQLPFVYNPFTSSGKLVAFGGTYLQVSGGISENGMVAGEAEAGISPVFFGYSTNTNTNTTVNAGSPGGNGLSALVGIGVNNSGWIAGKGVNAYSTSDPNVWNGSAWVDLGQGASSKGGAAIALDNSGDVAGLIGVSSALKGDPFYDAYNGSGWNGFVDLGNLQTYNPTLYSGYSAGQPGGPGALNNGVLVGWDFNGTKSASTEYAIIAGTTANSTAPLANYVTSLGDFTRLSQAWAIDSEGDIVGVGLTTTGGSTTDVFLLTPVPTQNPGNVNEDGKVDINDLTIVLNNYGKTGQTWTQGSMDGDPTGTVDINDLSLVLSNYGMTYGASSGIKAVPEPSCVVLLGIGAVGLLAFAYRKRRRA